VVARIRVPLTIEAAKRGSSEDGGRSFRRRTIERALDDLDRRFPSEEERPRPAPRQRPRHRTGVEDRPIAID
jgi:hypothetical protein